MSEDSVQSSDQKSNKQMRSQRLAELIRHDPTELKRAWKAGEFPFESDDESPVLVFEEFEGIEFSDIRFFPNCENVIFESCYFEACIFESNQFTECQFKQCGFVDCSLTSSFIEGCSFSESSLQGVNFEDCSIKRSKFSNSILVDGIMHEALLESVQFSRVDFARIHGRWMDVHNCSIFESSLYNVEWVDSFFTNFRMPYRPMYMSGNYFRISKNMEELLLDEDLKEGCINDFSGTTFADSSFSQIDFNKTDLTGTTLGWCDLSGADLRDAIGLTPTTMPGSDLNGAKVPGDTSFLALERKTSQVASLARPAYLALLANCLFLWAIFVFGAPSADVKIPLFAVDIPRTGFAYYMLLQGLAINLYANTYVMRAAHLISRYPVIFPSGEPSPEVASSWSLFSPAWLHLRVLPPNNHLMPPVGFWQQYLMSLFSYWLVLPITGLAVIGAGGLPIESVQLLAALSALALAVNTTAYLAMRRILRSKVQRNVYKELRDTQSEFSGLGRVMKSWVTDWILRPFRKAR